MSNIEYVVKKTKDDLNYASDKKPVQSKTGADAKPLPKVTIDGKVYEFMPGDTIMPSWHHVQNYLVTTEVKNGVFLIIYSKSGLSPFSFSHRCKRR